MQLRDVYRSAVEHVVLPYVRHELPAWGPIYKHLIGGNNVDRVWRDAGRRTFKDKIHGFEVELDLATWSDRLTYFLGRYYDLPTQLLIERALQEGDHAFDVGANIGHIALMMVRCVGETGRVDAFEPSPYMCDRLRANAAHNGIRNLFVHAYGLSSDERVLQLHIPKVSPGETTFTPTPYPKTEVETIDVPVKRGDTIVREVGPPVLVKIDVEGFECNVIDGLAETLEEHRPIVITEVMIDHLARAGQTPEALFDRMRGFGYEPLRQTIRRNGLSHELLLHPVAPDQIHYADVVWFDPNERDHRERLGFVS